MEKTLDNQKTANPANAQPKRVTAATRIPMSIPKQNLEVPEIDGFHLHWFLGRRVNQALQAGYEFVDNSEVELTNKAVADNSELSGSTDMGSRVSVLAGPDENNQPERLYLMKIQQEWYNEDQKVLAERNEKVAQALRGGLLGAENDPDVSKRYLKTGASLFIPKN